MVFYMKRQDPIKTNIDERRAIDPRKLKYSRSSWAGSCEIDDPFGHHPLILSHSCRRRLWSPRIFVANGDDLFAPSVGGGVAGVWGRLLLPFRVVVSKGGKLEKTYCVP